MLYFELGINNEDYLTENEYIKFGNFRRIIWNIKSIIGIVVKKKLEDKFIYVIPRINKRYINKIKKIIKITGQKNVCISDELFYKDEVLNFFKENEINICDGLWCMKYMLINILDYIYDISKKDFETDEIAFLVDSDYEIVIEYIKLLASRFKLVTVVTSNIKRFSKIEEKYFKDCGIEINLVNNYRKSLNKSNIIVNIDFSEDRIKKYTIYNKACFINLGNKYEINKKDFSGINVTKIQIAMPNKYLIYSELFYNFNYMNVYESFIKKRTSISNILNEIQKDEIQIICLENENGIIKIEDFFQDVKKILDKK